MNTKFLAILTILALSIGCQQGKSTSNGQPQATTRDLPQKQREVLSNGVVIEIYKLTELRDDRSNYGAFKQNLNIFETKITIPENIFTSDLEILRSLNSDSLNPFYEIITKDDAELIDNNKYVIFDRISYHGSDFTHKNVTYKVYTNEVLNGESKAELVPDLIIENNAEATTLQSLGISTGKYDFGVIVFENNSVLRTEGSSIMFKAKRVFAENAIVESFSKDFTQANSSVGQPGKNGGSFKLQADSAWGDLTINMRGTAGGQGYPAKVQNGVGSVGAKGTNGRRYTTFCEPIGPMPREPRFFTVDSKSIISMKSPDRVLCEWECEKPGNGGAGGVGPVGYDGGIGMPGGLSGQAEIIVKEELVKFHVEVTHTAGSGGLGGEGGAGGQGGSGGSPGDIAEYCHEGGSVGATGAQGATGARGPKGEDGLIEQSSVIIGSKQLL